MLVSSVPCSSFYGQMGRISCTTPGWKVFLPSPSERPLETSYPPPAFDNFVYTTPSAKVNKRVS